MLTVDDYGEMRRANRDGLSLRAIARALHHSRRKVREALACSEPRPYTRTQPPVAWVLDPFKALIDEILAADEQAPRKQRHTAMRLFRRLREEYGYPGSYSPVQRYVAGRRRHQRELFIPLVHDPGERLEADFGHIGVDFPEGRRPVPVLVLAWSYSNCPFALALPTERTEAILEGMVRGLAFFGCVPREVWWDNPRTVVAQLYRSRQRRLHERYAALASHYTFEPLFCLPARGQEKPDAEKLVYTLERRWATPVPRARDLAELNAHLLRCCLEERDRTPAGWSETIGQRFVKEQAAAIPLPPYPFDPCVYRPAQGDKYQTVRFDHNRYSVPRSFAFRVVTLKVYSEALEIVADGRVVARHVRSYERGQQILDPLDYLVTLARRPAALDHSPVYRHWRLPTEFTQLREELEQRHGPAAGARQYIRVLQLLAEHPLERVRQAITRCRHGDGLQAERIVQQIQRLTAAPPSPTAPLEGRDPVYQVRVPVPDLSHFDQLLVWGDPAYA